MSRWNEVELESDLVGVAAKNGGDARRRPLLFRRLSTRRLRLIAVNLRPTRFLRAMGVPFVFPNKTPLAMRLCLQKCGMHYGYVIRG